MTVYESDLPGVGKKFEVDIDDDERLVVVIHNTGKREVFRRIGDEDSVKLFEMSDRLARTVGSILEGAHFQPVATDTTGTMLDDDSLLEWVKVVEGSPLVGKTLEQIDFRHRTGASVVAIQHEGRTESNPGPDTVVRADDTLIVLGGRDACRSVQSLAGAEEYDTLEEVEATVDVDGTDADGTDVDGTDADGTDVDGSDADGTDVDGTDADGTEGGA